MLIKEISIKNFKSYGNIEQLVTFKEDKGELILLTGSNGSGKSSLIEIFEFGLYGKVKSGKKKKFSVLSSLPNRINGNLLVKLKLNSNNTNVEIERGLAPSILNLIEDGVPVDRAGKSNLDDKIEEYAGVDIETFKSFISMSINDFKNFLSLSNEEKQLLLDKLFNLEVINILNLILKDLNKSNKIQMTRYDAEIQALSDSISSIRQSIEKSIEKEKLNLSEEIETIKAEMESKKQLYISLKEKVELIKSKEHVLLSDIDKEREQYTKIQYEIKNAQKDIDLYDSGKCPTCGVNFDNDHFHNLKDILISKTKSLNDIKLEIESNIKSLKEKQNKLQTISDNVTKDFNDLNYLLKNYKNNINKLELSRDKEDGKDNQSIQEFKNSINDLMKKKSFSEENILTSKSKELYYKELSKIFGEDGVKKSIIAGIIKPINHYIAENMKKMGLPFQVILDDTFTANIKSMGEEIEHDSLSTGEYKLLNINLLISYTMLIRNKKYINILFLDEVFSSIDLDNIDKILDLLKSFANEYKINVFVVHHAALKQEMFDRIISIDKSVFSCINEMNIE